MTEVVCLCTGQGRTNFSNTISGRHALPCSALHYTKLGSVITATKLWLLSCICQLIQVLAGSWCRKGAGVPLNSFNTWSLMSNKWLNIQVNTQSFIWLLLYTCCCCFNFFSGVYKSAIFNHCCYEIVVRAIYFVRLCLELCWHMKLVQAYYIISGNCSLLSW